MLILAENPEDTLRISLINKININFDCHALMFVFYLGLPHVVLSKKQLTQMYPVGLELSGVADSLIYHFYFLR